MSDFKPENPIRKQSKEWLSQALLLLMKKRPYNKLTILQISEFAGLSRRTFYRHFKTIDELLIYSIQLLSEDFVNFFIEHVKEKDFNEFILLFFTYWQDRKEVLLTFLDNRMMHMLLNDFMPMIKKNIHKILNLKHGLNPPDEYTFYFVSGGTWNMLVKWITEGSKETPEMLAESFSDIMDRFQYLVRKPNNKKIKRKPLPEMETKTEN